MMLNDAIISRAVEVCADLAQAMGRRLSVLMDDAVPAPLASAVLRTGAVSHVVRGDARADVSVSVLSDPSETEHLRRAAWYAGNGLVLFDPHEVAPVAARRAVAAFWPDLQPWVLPLEGPDAFTGGIITASPQFSSATPRMSATMPVNLEEKDVERVLASMLPVCAEWVVGVDTKSTDGTLGIVERYADRVFRFTIEPWSFAEARNRCIDRCSHPWVFMTEGHESLDQQSIGMLRNLANVKLEQGVLMVGRDTGGADRNSGEFFYFPWVFRNHPAFRFADQNGVHNALKMDGYAETVDSEEPVCVRLPGVVRTFHTAHHENRVQRHEQRKEMNRAALDAKAEESEGGQRGRALFYAAQEHASAGDLRTAARRMLSYIREGDTFSEQMYEAHLRLGEYLMHMEKHRMAVAVLRRGLPWDLTRAEIEFQLAECYAVLGDDEVARQLYAKAAGVPLPNYSMMFVRKPFYGKMPWQGLAMACHRLGESGKARDAARACLHFDPENETAHKIIAAVPA